MQTKHIHSKFVSSGEGQWNRLMSLFVGLKVNKEVLLDEGIENKMLHQLANLTIG